MEPWPMLTIPEVTKPRTEGFSNFMIQVLIKNEEEKRKLFFLLK